MCKTENALEKEEMCIRQVDGLSLLPIVGGVGRSESRPAEVARPAFLLECAPFLSMQRALKLPREVELPRPSNDSNRAKISGRTCTMFSPLVSTAAFFYASMDASYRGK